MNEKVFQLNNVCMSSGKGATCSVLLFIFPVSLTYANAILDEETQ